MKKLMVCSFMLMIILTTACVKKPENAILLNIGPYTYDASGSDLYSYDSEEYLEIEYPTLTVVLQHYSYEYILTDKANLEAVWAGDWDIANVFLEYIYGPDSTYARDYFLGYSAEPLDLTYYPACALFNTETTIENGSAYVSGAVMADKEGVLLIECFTWGMSHDNAAKLRSDVLELLKYKDASVVSPEKAAAEYALQEARRKDTSAPISIPVGKFYEFDASGCISYNFKEEGYNSAQALYGDTEVYMQFFPPEELPHESVYMTIKDTNRNQALARYMYNNYILADWFETNNYNYILESNIVSDGSAQLKYTARNQERYGGGYSAGSIIATEHGALLFECSIYNNETNIETIRTCLEKLLTKLTFKQK